MKVLIQRLYNKKIVRVALAALMLFIPLYLIYLPKEYFNTGQSICLYTLATGEECSGCGLTRAVMHLIHLDIHKAVQYNYLCIIVFPILAFMYLLLFLNVISKLKIHE